VEAGTRGNVAAWVTGNDGTRWAATRASLLSAASMARELARVGVCVRGARGVVGSIRNLLGSG
jgi:predicted amino acid dehydrogenase